MNRLFFILSISLLLFCSNVLLAQKAVSSDSLKYYFKEVTSLKAGLDTAKNAYIKRESEILKRENEILAKYNEILKGDAERWWWWGILFLGVGGISGGISGYFYLRNKMKELIVSKTYEVLEKEHNKLKIIVRNYETESELKKKTISYLSNFAKPNLLEELGFTDIQPVDSNKLKDATSLLIFIDNTDKKLSDDDLYDIFKNNDKHLFFLYTKARFIKNVDGLSNLNFTQSVFQTYPNLINMLRYQYRSNL